MTVTQGCAGCNRAVPLNKGGFCDACAKFVSALAATPSALEGLPPGLDGPLFTLPIHPRQLTYEGPVAIDALVTRGERTHRVRLRPGESFAVELGDRVLVMPAGDDPT